jgi:hypothetical protein
VAEAKKRLTEMFFKYLEIFGLIAAGMFLGWLLFGSPARASLGDVVYNNDAKEIEMEEFEPFTLSYEWPVSQSPLEHGWTISKMIPVSVYCESQERADFQFKKMFELAGNDVEYSID